MSLLLTVKGRRSTLSTDFQPPIELDPDSEYSLALLSFHSYNSVPKIVRGQKFYLIDPKEGKLEIALPEGSYEISDIEDFIRKSAPKNSVSLKSNNNTLKCEIYSDTFSVDFRPEDSIAYLFGFSPKLLKAKKLHISDLAVNIVKVRTIHIDTNITSGAFYNDQPSHTIYEFAVGVDPGFAINETPTHLIYLPVLKRREISNITLAILDQDSELVNFRGKEIILRVELKKYGASSLS